MDRDIFFFSRFLVHFQYAVIEMTLRPSNSSKQWRRDYVQSMLDATRFIYIVVGPCWGYTAMVNVWWGRANTKEKREIDEKPIAIKLCIDAVEWNLFVHFLPFFFFYFLLFLCSSLWWKHTAQQTHIMLDRRWFQNLWSDLWHRWKLVWSTDAACYDTDWQHSLWYQFPWRLTLSLDLIFIYYFFLYCRMMGRPTTTHQHRHMDDDGTVKNQRNKEPKNFCDFRRKEENKQFWWVSCDDD